MDETKKKSLIKQLYDFSFREDSKWNNWFFENVYCDDEAKILTVGDNIASSLFLHKYRFLFHEEEVGLAYISGASTDMKFRHKGYMANLIHESLHEAYERGDIFAGLIPANRLLYFFYDKFNFATVVYSEIERYTSAHAFPVAEGYEVVEPDYNSFHSLERNRNTTILHSERDFKNILEDTKLDKGTVVQVNGTTGLPLAMAFATADGNEIHVKEVLGTNPTAVEMALGAAKNNLGCELPMVVWREPTGRRASMRTRGMMRILNVYEALQIIASHYPATDQVIRVTDRLIPENNGIYILKGSNCQKVDETLRKLTLDVSVDVLTKIMFSGENIGNIFNIPSSHPMMPLMLD